MCKNSKFGLKQIGFILLLSLVVCSQAFSWAFLKPKAVEEPQIVQAEAVNQELENQVKSLTKSLEEAQKELQKQEAILKDLKSKSPTYQNIIEESQKESMQLSNQIEMLKNDLELLSIINEEQKIEIEAIRNDYTVKAEEADKYFVELTEANAELNAIETVKPKAINFMLGANATWNKGWGVELIGGIGFRNIFITGGVGYKFGTQVKFKPIVEGVKAFNYRAGVAIIF